MTDEKGKDRPHRDVDIRAYQFLSDFNAYLSDQGLKANPRLHSVTRPRTWTSRGGRFS